MAKSIIVKCENCGKEIKKYQSQIKNYKWRTGRTGTINNPKGITKKCLCCDKEFYVYPCEINTKIYCSNTCMYKHKSDNGDYSGKNCNFYVRGYYEDDRDPNWEKEIIILVKNVDLLLKSKEKACVSTTKYHTDSLMIIRKLIG